MGKNVKALGRYILLLFLVLASSSAFAVERPELTEITLQYGDNSPLKLYANTKYAIKVLGFPNDAHLAQIMPRLRSDFLDLRIIGDRSVELANSSLGSSNLEFVVQVPTPQRRHDSTCNRDPNAANTCTEADYVNYGELKLKTYNQTGETSYSPLDDYSIPVQSTFCLVSKPVCGSKDGRKVTYSDMCELNKAKAELLYENSCK